LSDLARNVMPPPRARSTLALAQFKGKLSLKDLNRMIESSALTNALVFFHVLRRDAVRVRVRALGGDEIGFLNY